MALEAPAINRNETAPSLAYNEFSFYRCTGKRIVDSIVAAATLALISPLLLLISAIVKLTSSGPVLYTQDRVGRGGRLFKIIKFRSMAEDADQKGPGITSAGDPRITAVGKVLRRLKLDELPQLWNVLKGDMSLVGPRPELPLYVAYYDQRQKAVLSVRPGITDCASIAYRWEEELLAQDPAPEKFYREAILPRKLDLNLSYIARMSFAYDCQLLFHTVLSVVPSRNTSS